MQWIKKHDITDVSDLESNLLWWISDPIYRGPLFPDFLGHCGGWGAQWVGIWDFDAHLLLLSLY